MITGLDHVVLLVRDLSVASTEFERFSGRRVAWRSQQDGTDMALFRFANMAVELLAPRGAGPVAERINAALDAQGEGLASLCFGTGDMARMHRRLDRLQLNPEPVVSSESSDLATGAVQSWTRTRAATDATRGVKMFFVERPHQIAMSELATNEPDAALGGLDHVVVQTGEPELAAALYGARLGLDMALDRRHPDWGQLMFFRCGDLIVEVVNHARVAAPPGRDRLWGLSWRVGNIEAAHARLVASGVDVSEVRAGRRPGTRVASVRNGALGIPTMLLERTVRN